MTSLIQRCRACNGKKKLLGLGCIMKDCTACKGIGWTESHIEPQPAKPARSTIIDLTSTKKPQRGRPKPTVDLTVLTPES